MKLSTTAAATMLIAPLACGLLPGALGYTEWFPGSLQSNGEKIYFTGVNDDGQRIPYSGGPLTGMMMRGSLSCASCHGSDAQGGRHLMHMQVMVAPNIRWSSLAEHDATEDDAPAHDEFDIEAFRMAVVEGAHPDGSPFSTDMPRWAVDENDLQDLAAFLQSFP